MAEKEDEEYEDEYEEEYEKERRRDRRRYVCNVVRPLTEVAQTFGSAVKNCHIFSERCSRICNNLRQPKNVPIAYGCKKRRFKIDLLNCLKDAKDLVLTVGNQQASGNWPNAIVAKQTNKQFHHLAVFSSYIFEKADIVQSYCTEEEEEINSLLLDELCMTLNDSAFDQLWDQKYRGKDYSTKQPLHMSFIVRFVDTDVKYVRKCGLVVNQWLQMGDCDKDVAETGDVVVNEVMRLCDEIISMRKAIMDQRTFILKTLNVRPHDILMNLKKFDIVTGLLFRCVVSSLVNVSNSMVRFTFDCIHP